MPLTSQLFHGDASLEAAANVDSAHITPGARGAHVVKIQTALNTLDNAGLTTDGDYGAATANAVLNYKTKRNIVNRSYQSQADNIVGKMTMASLDAEMTNRQDSGKSVPVVGLSLHLSCEHGAQSAKTKKIGTLDLEPADPTLAALAISMLPKLRAVIRATTLFLEPAQPFIFPHRKLTVPKGPFSENAQRSIKLLINVFSMDQLDNPRPAYENIVRVYHNINTALHRSFDRDPFFDTDPLLFVPNTHKSMETSIAYTAARGAFLPSNNTLEGINEPVDRIYICKQFATFSELFQVAILVHELAHFVSGQPLIIDHNHGVPKLGLMLRDRVPFDSIKAPSKLHSPEHYAFFAVAVGVKLFKTD